MGNEALNWDGLQLKKKLLQAWNTFYTRPQDIALRKWQGRRESPEDEVESWLPVESSFFFSHL